MKNQTFCQKQKLHFWYRKRFRIPV